MQIRQFEQTMGVRLLDRNTRTVRLTRIGQELSPIAQRLLREVEDLTHHAREMAAGARGVVSVAALASVRFTVLPRIISEIRTGHPGILIVLKDMPAQKVLGLVNADDVDFGIGSFAGPDPSIQIVPLFVDRLRVVFPKDSGLGIAFLPSSMVEMTDLSDMGSRLLNNPGLTRQIVAIHKSGLELSPSAKNFLRILVAECGKLGAKLKVARGEF